MENSVISIAPGQQNSLRLERRERPIRTPESMLVQSIALGVCGTDAEIIGGVHGSAPEGAERLVLGHETLGRVLEAPADCGFQLGDHVAGIVRRPDPVPCVPCAGGEWDMCANGLFTERGIKGRDGYAAQFYALEPEYAVRVDPQLGLAGVLVEPASVLCKAWQHIERIGSRTRTWAPRSLLVTGAGPVGLLAALMGRMRGLDLHVFDRAEGGVKPQLVKSLGGSYHSAAAGLPADLRPDVVLECTGAASVVLDVLGRTARNGIVCLVGVSAAGRKVAFDAGRFNREVVLENDVVFGTVNANRAHYEAAAQTLCAADRQWLDRLITRRVPLSRWQEAYEKREGDVKVVLQFDEGVH